MARLSGFDDLFAIAAARKGGAAAFAATLPVTKSAKELAALGEDRWLSMAARCVFQAGFSLNIY